MVDLADRVEKLEEAMRGVKKDVVAVTKKVENLESFGRRLNVLLFNYPDRADIARLPKSDQKLQAMKDFEWAMKQVLSKDKVDRFSYRDYHRIPANHFKEGIRRPIIVALIRQEDVDLIFSVATKLRSIRVEGRGLRIDRDLSGQQRTDRSRCTALANILRARLGIGVTVVQCGPLMADIMINGAARIPYAEAMMVNGITMEELQTAVVGRRPQGDQENSGDRLRA